MRYTFTAEEEDFRQEVRTWLEEQLPDGWDGGDESTDEGWAFNLEMRKKLADKGWLTLAWLPCLRPRPLLPLGTRDAPSVRHLLSLSF